MKTKLLRPVLVESKERTDLWSYKGRRLYYDQANFNDEDGTIYYQLILISLDPDEKIEENDSWIDHKIGEIEEESKLIIVTPENRQSIFHNIVKSKFGKVIATQDQLSPELINQLVAEYNNGGMQDFEIEMEIDIVDIPFCPHKPKLTNGFVTVVEKHVSNVLNDPDFESKKSIYSPFKVNEDSIVLYGAGKFGETSLVLDRDKSLLLFIELWKFLNIGKNLSAETNSDTFDRGFVAGENSVRERLEAVLYSDEEVKVLLANLTNDLSHDHLVNFKPNYTKDWFNENKKK